MKCLTFIYYNCCEYYSNYYLHFVACLCLMRADEDRTRAINMSASSVVYLRTAETSQHRSTEAAPVHAKKAGWRNLSFSRSQPPTVFQLCLALHMFVAERRGALD
jgi:hypothetical protein